MGLMNDMVLAKHLKPIVNWTMFWLLLAILTLFRRILLSSNFLLGDTELVCLFIVSPLILNSLYI